MEPVILKRNDHPVSRENFSEEALKVLYRLKNKGHKGYLAGGCVRDILLGRTPKDFDVATDATPNEVKRMFSNCRLIGRRFRLAHVNFHGGETIEVATFRALPPAEDNVTSKLVKKQDGLVTRDNEFGSPEEDALRRDFTVNALFYDISNFSIIDYAGGLKDIESRTLRCIGNPDERYIEDPVRMLRAVRFAATLDLTIEEETWDGIVRLATHLENTSNARLFEELGKWFNCGRALECFKLMEKSGLLIAMLPTFGRWVRDEASESDRQWIEKAFTQIDKWKANGVAPDPALQMELVFHPYHMARAETYSDMPEHEKLAKAVQDHQKALMPRVLISQGYMHAMIRILQLQKPLQEQNEKRMGAVRPAEFATAFVLFKFRGSFLGDDPEIATWWAQHIPEGKHRERHFAKRKRQRKPREKGPPPAPEA